MNHGRRPARARVSFSCREIAAYRMPKCGDCSVTEASFSLFVVRAVFVFLRRRLVRELLDKFERLLRSAFFILQLFLFNE